MSAPQDTIRFTPDKYPTEEQLDLDRTNRRLAVRNVIGSADDADDLVWLTAALELDEELDELATTPERQQRLALARAHLEETAGSLLH